MNLDIKLTLNREPNSTIFVLAKESEDLVDWETARWGHRFGMSADAWRDLGCPERLTVTVEAAPC